MDRSPKELWEAALGELELQVTRSNYHTWLKDTVGLSYQDKSLVVGTPTPFVAEWLEKRMARLIETTLSRIAGDNVQVAFQVAHRDAQDRETGWEPRGPDSLRGSGIVLGQQRSGPGRCSGSLNPRYIFDTFIVGGSNRLAHAAAQGVARSPGTAYNPLFVYSGAGLGKTHLLHAIGHQTESAGLDVRYVSAEQFTNNFITAIRERTTEDFRNKYRSADVLLVDDIQFISGKEQTQEGFFHTFNEIHNASHQIVISCDRPPKSLALLEERLRSRFEWGLIVDIQPPDLETRIAILRAKSEAVGVQLPLEGAELIARRFQKNIRELEGALNRVAAYCQLTHASLTVQTLDQALADLMVEKKHTLECQSIMEEVCRFYKLTSEDLKGRRRDKEIALARHVAMYLMREEARRPLVEIGRLLGNRDHTTVLHGCDRIASQVNVSNQLRRDVLEIKDALYRLTGVG